MSVFQKSIKVILVTWIAVQIATFLGLNYPSSAGIIGLLSLLDTRRSTKMHPADCQTPCFKHDVSHVGSHPLLQSIWTEHLGLWPQHGHLYSPRLQV